MCGWQVAETVKRLGRLTANQKTSAVRSQPLGRKREKEECHTLPRLHRHVTALEKATKYYPLVR
jgi:hypothetical protein